MEQIIKTESKQKLELLKTKTTWEGGRLEL